MAAKTKILVIRFNSIGDIVLTTPVLKALAKSGFEVHYLMKYAYKDVLSNCPYVKRIWCLQNSFSAIVEELKKENFDYVIDLHNNLRSFRVKFALRKKAFTLAKHRISMWLKIHLRTRLDQQQHIVERFLQVIKPLVQMENKPHVDFFLSTENERKGADDLPDRYHVIVVGAAYYTKTIPTKLLINLIDQSPEIFILIGGKEDILRSKEIVDTVTKNPINLTGKMNIQQSAEIIKNAISVITGDTGMMHIANALGKKTVAVFGSTHPKLGYTPYNNIDGKGAVIIQNDHLACRPCTKQGKHKCPKGHFKCMKEIQLADIVDKM